MEKTLSTDCLMAITEYHKSKQLRNSFYHLFYIHHNQKHIDGTIDATINCRII